MRLIFNKLFQDIRFWILVFFIIRLIGITNPPLEIAHNWRQTTVTMVSRNFLETDNNIFYPRVDMAGANTGITGMEFPLLNYLIYLVSKLFGYQHWYGRLINLIVSSIGLCFFYRLLHKYFSRHVAFYATIILAVSIWFQFSRKIMPDTFAMSMVIAGIYFGTNYLEGRSFKYDYLHLFGYLSLIILGVLSKLPSGYLLVVFGIFYWDKRIPVKRKLIFTFLSFLGFLPVFFWYFYWVHNLVDQYHFWHFFMGVPVKQGFADISSNFGQTLSRFYDTALKFIGFAVFIYGMASSIVKKDRIIISLFILTLISFSIVILKAGYAFPHHSYYIIPFVPVMALIAGYGLEKIRYHWMGLLLLVALSVEGIANQQHDFRIKEKEYRILNLEKDLDRVSRRHDLIFINSGAFPTPIYFSHRKGWIGSNEEISNEQYISKLKKEGLKYIVILKRSFGTEIALNQYLKVMENEDYCIYKLQPR